MTNKERVLNYMREFGSITPLEAIRDLGNTRLSASIFELKKDGYNIITRKENSINRWGKKTSYARYFLVEEMKKFTFKFTVMEE